MVTFVLSSQLGLLRDSSDGPGKRIIKLKILCLLTTFLGITLKLQREVARAIKGPF